MNAPFRLFGADFSAYSNKVRSYLKYKGVAFDWIARDPAHQAEFAGFAQKPMAPVLVDADQNVLQDSTAIIAAVELAHAEPSITPSEPALAALSAVLEDYADEWLSKAMFFYRWSKEEDSAEAAKRVADLVFPEAEAPEDVLSSIRTRMGGRLHHVGATPDNAALIEGSFARLLEVLEVHLAGRSYLFGGRPALADFALFAQLQQLAADPTPGAIMRTKAPQISAWIKRLENPSATGEFETLEALKPTLLPLVAAEVSGAYLPWMLANAEAVGGEGEHVSVALAGGAFSQKPQRNAAKSFADVQRICAARADDALRAFLSEAGAGALLNAAEEADEDEEEAGGEDIDPRGSFSENKTARLETDAPKSCRGRVGPRRAA